MRRCTGPRRLAQPRGGGAVAAPAVAGAAANADLSRRPGHAGGLALLDLRFPEDDVLADDRIVLLQLELAGAISDVLLGHVEVARFRAADQLDLNGVRLGHGGVFRFPSVLV